MSHLPMPPISPAELEVAQLSLEERIKGGPDISEKPPFFKTTAGRVVKIVIGLAAVIAATALYWPR